MIERFRAALVSSYAGAVMVGWTLAQGITNVAALVMSPFIALAIRYSNQRQGPPYVETRIFDPIELGVAATKAVVVLGIGLVLLHWLYIRGESDEKVQGTEEGTQRA